MDKNKTDFISLLKSFLRNIKPVVDTDTDWNAVYDLAQAHNVTGIITHEIMLLPKELQPESTKMSHFRQILGYTLLSADKKDIIKSETDKALTQAKIMHAYIKGSEIGKYYPVPELRTSGDIDIYVSKEDFEKASNVMSNIGYEKISSSSVTIGFKKHHMHIEVHCDADVGFEFFDNLFNRCESDNGYTFYMKDEYKLLFIICHMIKHIKCYGAGIKMLMDVDALISKDNNFDEEEFLLLCDKAGCKNAAQIILSLSSYWLGTDVKMRYDFDSAYHKHVLELFEYFMIDSGCFGLDNASIGGIYLGDSASKGKDVTLITSIKAFFRFLFPSNEMLKDRYTYARKHPILLPAAWFNRVFEGIFCRGGRTIKTAGEIFSVRDLKSTQNELITALDV